MTFVTGELIPIVVVATAHQSKFVRDAAVEALTQLVERFPCRIVLASLFQQADQPKPPVRVLINVSVYISMKYSDLLKHL